MAKAAFLEYEDVLLRPEHRLVTGMSEYAVADFLAAFASAAEPVEVHFQWLPQLPDPADELILEAAVNGRAGAMVTQDVRDFAAAELARLDGVSLNQFIAAAVAEKVGTITNSGSSTSSQFTTSPWMSAGPLHANHRVGNGGQGRNRSPYRTPGTGADRITL